MDKLYYDILDIIFQKLPTRDWMNFRLTCKHVYYMPVDRDINIRLRSYIVNMNKCNRILLDMICNQGGKLDVLTQNLNQVNDKFKKYRRQTECEVCGEPISCYVAKASCDNCDRIYCNNCCGLGRISMPVCRECGPRCICNEFSGQWSSKKDEYEIDYCLHCGKPICYTCEYEDSGTCEDCISKMPDTDSSSSSDDKLTSSSSSSSDDKSTSSSSSSSDDKSTLSSDK